MGPRRLGQEEELTSLTHSTRRAERGSHQGPVLLLTCKTTIKPPGDHEEATFLCERAAACESENNKGSTILSRSDVKDQVFARCRVRVPEIIAFRQAATSCEGDMTLLQDKKLKELHQRSEGLETAICLPRWSHVELLLSLFFPSST